MKPDNLLSFRWRARAARVAVLEAQGASGEWVEIARWSGPCADQHARRALLRLRLAAGLPAYAEGVRS